MRQAIQNQMSDEIKWIFLCRDELGDEHYLEPRIFDRSGEVLKVTCLMVYSLPEQSKLGTIAAVQSLQLINIKTGTTRILKEVLVDPEGKLLHLDEDVKGNDYTSPPGSVAEQKMVFIRKLLHDCKRQRLSIKPRYKKHLVKRTRRSKYV